MGPLSTLFGRCTVEEVGPDLIYGLGNLPWSKIDELVDWLLSDLIHLSRQASVAAGGDSVAKQARF